MAEAILFDLDGTLIDSTSAILASFEHAFKHFDLPSCDSEKIKALIGLPLEDAFLNLFPNLAHLNSELIRVYREKYAQIYLKQTTLLPFAKEAIILASSFAKLGVVTTKSSLFSKPLLDFLGVGGYFSVIIGREDVSRPKPDAEPILKALEALKVKNVFMIGDTKFDILAAKAANINAIALSCGYESKQSLEKYGVVIKSNPLEAVEFVRDFKYA